MYTQSSATIQTAGPIYVGHQLRPITGVVTPSQSLFTVPPPTMVSAFGQVRTQQPPQSQNAGGIFSNQNSFFGLTGK